MQSKCQQEVEGWEEIKGGGLGGSAGTSLLRKHIWGVVGQGGLASLFNMLTKTHKAT